MKNLARTLFGMAILLVGVNAQAQSEFLMCDKETEREYVFRGEVYTDPTEARVACGATLPKNFEGLLTCCESEHMDSDGLTCVVVVHPCAAVKN